MVSFTELWYPCLTINLAFINYRLKVLILYFININSLILFLTFTDFVLLFCRGKIDKRTKFLFKFDIIFYLYLYFCTFIDLVAVVSISCNTTEEWINIQKCIIEKICSPNDTITKITLDIYQEALKDVNFQFCISALLCIRSQNLKFYYFLY